MNAKTSKACDGCRLRKVKCNGQKPKCQQCEHLNLACNFSAPKNRRQIVRGSRLAQLKSPKDQQGATAQANPIAPSPAARELDIDLVHSRLHSGEFFYSLLEDYESVVFPVNPVIPRTEVVDAIRSMDRDAGDSAFVYAYAAVTINLARVSTRDAHNGDVIADIADLMALSSAARARAEAAESLTRTVGVVASVRKIMTCIFLEICLMAFKKYERAFVVLREAISMIQMLEARDRKGGFRDGRNDADVARRQRLYWEAFVHERFLTIMTSYPSILPPLRTGLPLRDPTIPAHVNVGFTRIIKLFLIIDDDLLRHWMAQGDAEVDRPEMTAAWIEYKQQQLDDDEHDAEDDEKAGLTELQVADLFITRLWLRTLIWQLAMSRCLLSSSLRPSAHEGLSLAFPAQRLSTQLQNLLRRLESQTSITVHGSGILEKLFEITNTIVDVVTVVSSPGRGKNPVQDLVPLLKMLLSFERVDPVQKTILGAKMDALVKKFPEIGDLADNFIG